MGEDERPPREVENVELDEVDAVLEGRPERAQRVLRRKARRTPMSDPEDVAVAPVEVDHRATPLRVARSHHQARTASSTAWATAMPAASRETSTQNCSG